MTTYLTVYLRYRGCYSLTSRKNSWNLHLSPVLSFLHRVLVFISFPPSSLYILHLFQLGIKMKNISRVTQYIISTFSSPTLEAVLNLPNGNIIYELDHFTIELHYWEI
jgi:hypothetical protein